MIDRRKVSLCHQIFVLTLVLGGPAALGSRSAQALAGDWPLWRFDASRRASSEEELPESLKLQWAIQLPEPTPAWPTTQKKLQFDNKYEPILGEGLLFISSMRHDCVTAFDSETGEERWRFYGDGPFRLAPAYWKGRVIAGCDDGHVYCLSAQKGELLWKFRAGASGRRLLGNQRMINTWPVRGAPVIYDDTLYVGAGIWPFMGVFLHALNPEDGSVIWTNSGSGSDFLTQQHNSPAFAGVAPQGYIAATKDRLIVSGGRTLPAVYDRKTGKYVHYNVASRRMGSKGGGGYTVVCGENFYINSGGMYRMDNGKWVLNVDAPVFSQYSMIAVDGSGGLLGYRHGFHEEKFRDKKGKEQTRTVVKKSWSGFLEEKIQELFIKSGSRVYGLGSGNRVLAIDLPRLDRGSRISWSTKLEGKPVSLITGNSRLFVVTDKARLYCYGEAEVKPNLPEAPAVVSGTVDLVPMGSTWRYSDKGREPPTTWTRDSFDDSSWGEGAGELGYGDGDEATKLSFGGDKNKKYVSYFFRQRFQVAEGQEFESAELELKVDDGAVIYLNGSEAGRVNMPDGEVKYDTKATGDAVEETTDKLKVDARLLRPGDNLLAVRVHQKSQSSSDISLDVLLRAELTASRKAPEYPEDSWRVVCGDILRKANATAGHALVLGLGTGRLAEEIAAQSKLQVLVLENDATAVEAFRRRLQDSELLGTRISILREDPKSLATFPPYFAELITSESPEYAESFTDEAALTGLFRLLRPYSGVASFPASSRDSYRKLNLAVRGARLDAGRLERSGRFVLLRRTDAPAGSGTWSHQNGDGANTVASTDELVKTPLGLLWFGGPSNEGVLPRHGHGPTPQVAGGRLVIEGRDMLRATDIYTGRFLWERSLKDLGKDYDYTSHEPGANAIGSNYVTLDDAVYVVFGKGCLQLDPASGETKREFVLPVREGFEDPQSWGYIGVSEDTLVAGGQPVSGNSAYFSPGDVNGIKPEHLGGKIDDVKAWTGIEKGKRQFVAKPNEAEEKKLKKEEREKRQKERKSKQEGFDRRFIMEHANRLLALKDIVSNIPEERRKKVKDQKKLGEIIDRLKKYLEGQKGRRTTDHDALVIKRELLAHIYGLPGYKSVPNGKFNAQGRSASKKLFGIDRQNGKIRWEYEAKYVIRHNAIALGGGAAYFLDRMPPWEVSRLKRRGKEVPKDSRLVAIDLRTGKEAWGHSEKVFGTWVGYSAEHDLVLQAGSKSRDRANDEVGQGMAAYRASNGEMVWHSDEKYDGPPILVGDSIITQGNSSSGYFFDLLTGKRQKRKHPLSDSLVDQFYTRNYGCNTALGAPNLLTFRSAAAGYFDLAGDGGTGNFGGFRSGCTSNLIPAGGILNAPDYTRTCTCSYQNQSSLALVHDPSVEVWTFNKFAHDKKAVVRAGLNFGAPGDRRDGSGTLWLDFPSVGGASPNLPVEHHAKDKRFVRYHSSRVASGPLPWVGSSNVEGEGEITLQLRWPEKVEVPSVVKGAPKITLKNGDVATGSPNGKLGDAKNESSLRPAKGFQATLENVQELAASSLTVEFWVRTDADIDYVDCRGPKKVGGFVFDNRQLRLRFMPSNEKGDGPGKLVKLEKKDVRLKDKTWSHVAFSYDQASGVAKIFLNGKAVLKHDGPDGRALWWGDKRNAWKILVGAANDQTRLDELRVHSRALQPEEFLSADRNPAADSKGLVGHWRMEDNAENEKDKRAYQVRLVFAEIEGKKAGERVFDVELQGKKVLENFDVAKESGGSQRSIVRSFRDIAIGQKLRVRLKAVSGAPPILSGLEVVEQSKATTSF